MLPGSTAADQAMAQALNTCWSISQSPAIRTAHPCGTGRAISAAKMSWWILPAMGPKAVPDPWRTRLDPAKHAEQKVSRDNRW